MKFTSRIIFYTPYKFTDKATIPYTRIAAFDYFFISLFLHIHFHYYFFPIRRAPTIKRATSPRLSCFQSSCCWYIFLFIKLSFYTFLRFSQPQLYTFLRFFKLQIYTIQRFSQEKRKILLSLTFRNK